MARYLRCNVRDGWYHITTRGVGRREIFGDDRDREHFVKLLGELVGRYDVILHAYVLMENHYHLLIETPYGNASRALQWLNVSYAAWYNARHRRNGQLFQGRYKSIPIQGDGSWALTCSIYLHLNPVRIRALGLGKEARAAEKAGVMPKPTEQELIQHRLTGNVGTRTNARSWRRLLPFTEVAQAVETVRGAKWAEFVERRGDWGRDLALYVGRMHGGMTLQELATHANMNLDTVQSCVIRVRNRLKKQKKLRCAYAQVMQTLAVGAS